MSNQRAVCQALFNIDFIGAISAMTSPDLIAIIMARRLQPTTLTAVPLFHVSGLHARMLLVGRQRRKPHRHNGEALENVAQHAQQAPAGAQIVHAAPPPAQRQRACRTQQRCTGQSRSNATCPPTSVARTWPGSS